MFNSASKENRVVTTALTVTYETERHYETLPDGTLRYWWKVTRHASKDYRFVDMTEKAVILAAAVKVEMYTRQTRKCISRTLDKVCPSLTTSVQPEYNDCGSWDLVINVSETDSTHSATLPADPAALFTEENARDYDEGEGGGEIEIQYASTSFILVLVKGISEENFTNRAIIEFADDAEDPEWRVLSPADYSWRTPTPQTEGYTITAGTGGDYSSAAVTRVKYGVIISNVVPINPPE